MTTFPDLRIQEQIGDPLHTAVGDSIMPAGGTVLLFVGNAAYHKSARMRKGPAEWDGDVVTRYTSRRKDVMPPEHGPQ